MDRPRYPLCLPDFQLDRAEIHLEYHRNLKMHKILRTIKNQLLNYRVPDIIESEKGGAASDGICEKRTF